MKKTIYFILAVIIGLSMLSVGCDNSKKIEDSTGSNIKNEEVVQQSGSEEREEVVVLEGADRATLDPQFSGGLSEATIFEHIMDTLVGHDKDMNIIPRLATKWEVINDDYTWRFYLRDDVTFHDGGKFTAKDVKFSFDRAMNPDNKIKGNTAWLINNMNIDKVEVVDDYTVDITTKDPHPILTNFLAEFYILSENYYKDLPFEDAAVKPMGTGAYKFVEWKKGDRIIIERYDGYYGDKPSIKRIVWRAVPEPGTRIAELKTGGADIIYPLAPEMINEIGKNATAKSVKGGIRRFIGINLDSNDSHPALQDKRVRQALNYAVDVDTILQSLIGDSEAIRTGVTVNPPWQNENVKPYTYDPQKAKELLAEAGWKDTDGDGILDKNGEKLSLELVTSNGKSIKDLDLSQAVGGYLTEIGIETKVTPLEWTTYVGMLDSKSLPDLFYIGSGSTFEGQGDLADLQKDSSSNYGKWENSVFEDRWSQLIKEFDNSERQRLMNEMQEAINDDPPYIFLYFQVDIYGVSNDIDWEPSRDGRIRLHEAKLK